MPVGPEKIDPDRAAEALNIASLFVGKPKPAKPKSAKPAETKASPAAMAAPEPVTAAPEPAPVVEPSPAPVVEPVIQKITKGEKLMPLGWKLQTGELEGLPDQTWLLPGCFQHGHVSILYGPSTVGKSQIALCIGYATACGLTWGEEKFSPGLAMYVACEDIESMKVRARAWRILHSQLVDPDVDSMTWFNGEQEPMFNLLDPDRMAALGTEILAEQKAKKKPVRALIIDHRRKAMIPMPNQLAVRGPLQAIHVMQALRAMAVKYQMAVILLAHTEKGGRRLSGPQEWEDYAQSVFRVTASEDHMILECEKQRAAPLKDIMFKRYTMPVGKTDRGKPNMQPAVQFEAFVAEKDAPAENLFLKLAGMMTPGTQLGLPDCERLIGIAVGGEQHKMLRRMIPADKWKKQTVNEPFTALRMIQVNGRDFVRCELLTTIEAEELAAAEAAEAERARVEAVWKEGGETIEGEVVEDDDPDMDATLDAIIPGSSGVH